jgi:hypothetical protein
LVSKDSRLLGLAGGYFVAVAIKHEASLAQFFVENAHALDPTSLEIELADNGNCVLNSDTPRVLSSR